MEPLSALAIATATTPYLEQSLTVSRSLYDYFKGTKNPPELSKELRRESMLVSDVLDDLHKALASNVRNVSSSKVGRYADIVEVFVLTMTEMTARIQVKSKEVKKRLKWPFTARENQEYLGKFERYTSTFMLALQIVQGQNVQDQISRNALVVRNSHQMSQNAAKTQREGEGNAIISDFRKAPHYFEMDIFRGFGAKTQTTLQGTGGWVRGMVFEIDRIQKLAQGTQCWRWQVANHVSTYFDVSNRRSCVVDDVAKWVGGRRASVAYVYFGDTNSKRHASEIIRSLLAQVLGGQTVIPREIEDLYDEYNRRSTTPHVAVFKRHLLSLLSRFPSSFVLFDAVDELDAETVTPVTGLVSDLRNAGARVLCTSNTVSLKTQLGEPEAIEIGAHDDDLVNYLTTRLNIEWEYDDEFKQEIVETLTEKAHGNFLLAKFQLTYILSFSEPQDSLDALERLPPYLDAAYHEVWERIDKSKSKPTAIKVLSWVFHARRPITIDELREAISIRPFRQTALQPKFLIREDSLVKYCQGLITIDQNDNDDKPRTVRFTHSTIREFLQKFYIDKLLTHIDLAKVCLTYLTFDEFELGPCHDTYTLLRQMGQHRFWSYCVDHWGAHTRGEAEEDQEVVRGVCNLLASTGARSSMHQLILSRHGFTKTVFVSSSPIRVLAEEGLATIYQYLLKKDPKAFQQSDSNEVHNQITHTPLLSAKDADIDPLLIAIGNGHCRMAAALLASGYDVNVRSRTGETPLHIAAKRGHDEAMTLLLSQGGNIDGQDKRFRAPLHLACKYGHTETVVHLLEAGANLNVECQEGWTPLHFAVAHGRLDVNVLLERGANVFAKDHRGFTPLETAVKVADVSNFEKLVQTTIKQSKNTQVSLSGTDVSLDGIRNLPFRPRQRELHRQLGVYFPDSEVKLHL